jgi:hypothetical protein
MQVHERIVNAKCKAQSAKCRITSSQNSTSSYNRAVLKTRLVNLGFILAILIGLVVLVLCFIFVLPRFPLLNRPPKIANSLPVLQQVQTLSQLVTVKYVLEKVIIVDDTQPPYLPGQENRLLMVAHGIVKAGVDLGELKEQDIQVSKGRIRIKLPPARVTDTYLDDKQTQVVERSTGFLRRFDKDLEQNARRQAVEDLNRAARSSGILKDADERARAQLTHLFQQMGYPEVEFRQ